MHLPANQPARRPLRRAGMPQEWGTLSWRIEPWLDVKMQGILNLLCSCNHCKMSNITTTKGICLVSRFMWSAASKSLELPVKYVCIFSKEIIKKDIPLLLESYFRGKYFERCGSVHLGAVPRLRLRQWTQMGRWGTEMVQNVVSPPSILPMADCGSLSINISYAIVRKVASLWEMLPLLKNDNDHTKTSLTNKCIMRCIMLQAFC